MTHGHTIESLVLFEQRVADAFEAGKVKGPIHLCSATQAQPLLDIFREVRSTDWIFCTWRNHFHCLLKGMSERELFAEILAGRSMFVNSRHHRIVSSAIVGGILPIALGVALALKRKVEPGMVYVFAGDMAARTGLFHEFHQYADGHRLPVTIVVEDNGVSTNANTVETWGQEWGAQPRLIRYLYQRNRPHTGTGKHVTF